MGFQLPTSTGAGFLILFDAQLSSNQSPKQNVAPSDSFAASPSPRWLLLRNGVDPGAVTDVGHPNNPISFKPSKLQHRWCVSVFVQGRTKESHPPEENRWPSSYFTIFAPGMCFLVMAIRTWIGTSR